MTFDRNHPYLPSHIRGTQADSEQVYSPDNGPVWLEPVPTATVHYSWHFVSPQLLNFDSVNLSRAAAAAAVSGPNQSCLISL
jgi:hypothetical protein